MTDYGRIGRPFDGLRVIDQASRALHRLDFKWRAGADQIPVAVDVVHPAHGRPEFMDSGPRGWECRLLARVGPVPLITDHHARRMRGVLERVTVPVKLTGFDGFDFTVNRNQRVTIPVFDSLSVGSSINVPATGQDIVGAWNP